MYWLSIPIAHLSALYTIRHLDHLQLSFEEETIWVKTLSFEDIAHELVDTIPFKKVYEIKGDLLFIRNHHLPERSISETIIWKPIKDVLQVALPSTNSNYFGIQESLKIELEISNIEHEASVMLIERTDFDNYIKTAPEIRLKNLYWMLWDDKVLVYGTPLLPVKGITFWETELFLIPTGMHIRWYSLIPILREKLNPVREFYVLLQNNHYYEIPKSNFKPLTISSYRLTFS